MRYFFLLLLFISGVCGFSQTQVICPGDTESKTYWVDPVEGVTYSWKITSGKGFIFSGRNTNKVLIRWTSRTPATLLVTAKKDNKCLSEEQLTILFNGPTAELQPLTTTQFCAPPATLNATIKLTGNAPWRINYTLNGQTYTESNITTPNYSVPLTNLEHGTSYNIALTSVQDNTCTGTVSDDVITITIQPKLTRLVIIQQD